MGVVLLALGLVIVVEGLVYVLAPSLVEDMLAALRNMPIEARRVAGALALVTGLALIWFAAALGVDLFTSR